MVVKSRPVFSLPVMIRSQGITEPLREGTWVSLDDVPTSLTMTTFLIFQRAIINFYCVKALTCWNLFATVAKVILTNTHGLI